MHRRKFLKTTVASTIALAHGGLAVAAPAAAPHRIRPGIQLYTLRNQIAKDAPGTLKAVAAAGYRQVELFGFPKAGPMIAAARDAGLAIHSAHFEWDAVVNPKDEVMSDFSRILEQAVKERLSHLVIPMLHEPDRRTLDDYKKVAHRVNKAAEMAKQADIRLSYHNHSFEFKPLENGRSGYDVFIDEFSPDVGFEIDIFWVKVAALDPAALIRRLKGRVPQLHLKDLKDGIPMPDFGGGLPADAFQELGDGIIAMAPVLEAAADAGVEHCHVEQDQSPDPLASIRQSAVYLSKL